MGRTLAQELEGPVVTYGLDGADADVRATIESVDACGSRFRLTTKPTMPACRSIDESIHLPLVGRHNVSNAVAAAATAAALGIGAPVIREGLERNISFQSTLTRRRDQFSERRFLGLRVKRVSSRVEFH